MNLSYELTGNSYTILNDGVEWIKQDGFFPYPAETIEESAKKHIEQLLSESAAADEQGTELSQLQEDSAMIAETLAIALEEIEQLKAQIAEYKGA